MIYAFPSDGADRFASLASGIATDLASIDAWWNGQDPTRRIRFDLHAFPRCAPGFGQLDLTRAQLPQPGAYYEALGARLDRLVADLNGAPFGFTSADKKYLVYYDGPVDEDKVCGQGNAGLVDGGARAFSAVFLQACDQSTPGDGEGVAAITTAHEMIHGFDALVSPFPDPGPPNACLSDLGHPCDSALDILYPEGASTDTLSTRILDFGRDDYYGHSGPWWDVQDSPFLIHLGGVDAAPPVGPTSLRITSRGRIVSLSWPKASDDVGPVRYRVYRNGVLLQETPATTLRDRGGTGTTYLYGVRAADAAGFLSPLVEVRFRIGVGVVDAQGALLQDTVAPPPVKGLYASVRRSSLVLRWKAVHDAGGIRSYLVEKNRRRYRLISGTIVSVPLAKAKGTWSVRAVDRAGNVGPRFQSVHVG